MSKKEQILDILNLLVIQNSYSTDEAVEDILDLFNISDEEIEQYANELYYGTNFKQVFITGAKWMRDKIIKGNNE